MKHALLIVATGILLVTAVNAQSDQKMSDHGQDMTVLFQEDEFSIKWDYFIYPVPAVEEINVKITKGHISIHQVNIIDEFGNGLIELSDLSGDKLKIDVSELTEGKYFMQVIPDDKRSVKMKRFYIAN
jgi:hypothetical protein